MALRYVYDQHELNHGASISKEALFFAMSVAVLALIDPADRLALLAEVRFYRDLG